MARNGRTKVIFKGTFVSKQALHCNHICQKKGWMATASNQQTQPSRLYVYLIKLRQNLVKNPSNQVHSSKWENQCNWI